MRLFAASVISFLLLAQAALAQNFNYVDPAILPPEFLATPAKEGDPRLDAQATMIIKLQSNVTEQELKEANEEAILSPRRFLSAFPKVSDAKNFPKTHALIAKVDHDCHVVSDKAKEYWKTRRPFQVNHKIQLLVGKPNSMAYPSGHTTCSRIMAEVLGQVLPEERNAIRRHAAEIAYHRIIAGVHWPQDIAGGEQLALLYFGAVQQSEKYKADLKEAIAEITK